MKTIKATLVMICYIIACLAFAVPFVFVVLLYVVFIPVYLAYYLFVELLCKMRDYICKNTKC